MIEFNWNLFKTFLKQLLCNHPESYSAVLVVDSNLLEGLAKSKRDDGVLKDYRLSKTSIGTPATCIKCGVVVESLIQRSRGRSI